MPNIESLSKKMYSVKQISEMVSKQIQDYLSKYPTNEPINYMLDGSVAHTDNLHSPVPSDDYVVSNASGTTEIVHRDTLQPNQIEDSYNGLFDVRKAYANQFTSALIMTGAFDFFRKRMGKTSAEDNLGDGSNTYSTLYSKVYGDMSKAAIRATGVPYSENIADTMQNI
jgi:hypothetical protein